jgi:predicted 2-oxoglutarate/Fe(II)-dependent dioxygenase YbiX
MSADLSCTAGAPAGVVVGRESGAVDEEIRRAVEIPASSSWRHEVESRLDGARSRLSEHFAEPLTGFEGSVFLRYGPGSFYRPHHDSAARPPELGGDVTFGRRVSTVLFLNEPGTPPAGAYTGGQLILYGVIQDEGWKDLGFPVEPEAGLLVAFRSRLVHEVTPVTAGCRLSVVNWFY